MDSITNLCECKVTTFSLYCKYFCQKNDIFIKKTAFLGLRRDFCGLIP